MHCFLIALSVSIPNMPTIKPFCALMPADHLRTKVVTQPIENYSTGEAKSIADENDCSFLHLINPEPDHRYLRGSRQELIFKKIAENVEGFIDDQILVKEERPSIYIYRVAHDGLAQTGIWTLTHLNDYLEGRIKKHESTVERREILLADYLQQTGLDANPVLITYPPNQIIDALIENYTKLDPRLDFTYTDGSKHQVWSVSNENDLNKIIHEFGNMPAVYIADGHHRAAAMAKMQPQIHYFTTVYMNTREVKVLEFNRLVKDLGGLDPMTFIFALSNSFLMEKSAVPVKPSQLHQIGMYFNEQWYLLKPKKETYNEEDPVSVLDVSILQNLILDPLLKIKDPRTDPRISFEGGRTPVGSLQKKVDDGLFSIAFTLFPPAVAQVIAVADANGVMPPKSTWVEPKFLVGLLTNYFN